MQGNCVIMSVLFHRERVAKQSGPINFHGVGGHAPAFGAPKLHAARLMTTDGGDVQGRDHGLSHDRAPSRDEDRVALKILGPL
jgi:hypothetical protein